MTVDQPNFEEQEKSERPDLGPLRAELVDTYNNEISPLYHALSAEDKQWNHEEDRYNNPLAGEYKTQMSEIRQKVQMIDRYKVLDEVPEYEPLVDITELGSIPELQREYEEITQSIGFQERRIRDTNNELELIARILELPIEEVSHEVPTLLAQQERLAQLVALQEQVKGKVIEGLMEQNPLPEETSQNGDPERETNFPESFEHIANNLKRLSRLIQDRMNSGYNPLFQDESRILDTISRIANSEDIDSTSQDLHGLASMIEQTQRPRHMHDSLESLRQLSPVLLSTISDIENSRGRDTQSVAIPLMKLAENLSNAQSIVARRIQAIEEYQRQGI